MLDGRTAFEFNSDAGQGRRRKVSIQFDPSREARRRYRHGDASADQHDDRARFDLVTV